MEMSDSLKMSLMKGFPKAMGFRIPEDIVVKYTEELIFIGHGLYSLYRDKAVEKAWLKQNLSALNGNTPKDYILSGNADKIMEVKHLVARMCNY